MTEVQKSEIGNHIKKKIRVRKSMQLLTLFLVCVIPVFMIITVSAMKKTTITITADTEEILQGEPLPVLHVDIQDKKDKKIVLDKKTKYSTKDLVQDLHRGKGYAVKCNADTNKEGTYKVKVVLEEEFQKKLEKEWSRKVELIINDGTLKVKNPIGTWDGDKFKKYDGDYVTNAFVKSKEKTYYFDGKGVKVTGWKTINNKVYCFDKNGVMNKNSWKKKGKTKYYLGKDGAALTGWHDIKEGTYYFDRDGKMATGKVYVGLSQCKFDKNGKLLSKGKSKINPKKPMVALTFDDGPGKRTPELLEQLDKYNAHATFFMLGQKISSNKDVVKKMKNIGCELGNHSYDHTNLSTTGVGNIRKQIKSTNKQIKKAAGSEATVMRPPYGAISDLLKSNVGMPMILWNIDTLDWKTRNAQATINTVMNTVKDGDIILMHDIHSESIDAAIALIPKLQQAGYQLVTVSELAAAKEVELENGGRYTDF